MSKKEIDLEYKNLETIQEMIDKLLKHRNEILDNFAKAYLAEQKVMPSEIELVEQTIKEDNTIKEVIYFFRRKDGRKEV